MTDVGILPRGLESKLQTTRGPRDYQGEETRRKGELKICARTSAHHQLLGAPDWKAGDLWKG